MERRLSIKDMTGAHVHLIGCFLKPMEHFFFDVFLLVLETRRRMFRNLCPSYYAHPFWRVYEL